MQTVGKLPHNQQSEHKPKKKKKNNVDSGFIVVNACWRSLLFGISIEGRAGSHCVEQVDKGSDDHQ